MATPSVRSCPACGAQASGRFCAACGAALEVRPCAGCGTSLEAGTRFCPRCGRPASGAGRGTVPGPPQGRLPWLAAGAAAVLVLGLVAALSARESRARAGLAPAEAADPGGAPFAAGAPAGTPPDISTMTPRERFDRLYNRVMETAQAGDQVTAERFAPMALAAYTQLDSVDADARYHAALIMLHTGKVDGAAALADTILARTPTHLFGYVLRATVARYRKDQPALAAARQGFLRNYDGELKRGREEYAAHKAMLDEMRREAAAPPKGSS